MPPKTVVGQDVSVEIQPDDLRLLLGDIKAFDTKLATATRKRLRQAAEPAVADVRHVLLSGSYRTDAGLTRGLAAGTKVSIRTGVRTNGVSITTTGTKLPPEKRAMVKAFNQSTFRHPAFGNRDAWVNQAGRPYFGSVLWERRASMRSAMEQALHDALETIQAGTVHR